VEFKGNQKHFREKLILICLTSHNALLLQFFFTVISLLYSSLFIPKERRKEDRGRGEGGRA
jgi:hypothetical protein